MKTFVPNGTELLKIAQVVKQINIVYDKEYKRKEAAAAARLLHLQLMAQPFLHLPVVPNPSCLQLMPRQPYFPIH